MIKNLLSRKRLGHYNLLKKSDTSVPEVENQPLPNLPQRNPDARLPRIPGTNIPNKGVPEQGFPGSSVYNPFDPSYNANKYKDIEIEIRPSTRSNMPNLYNLEIRKNHSRIKKKIKNLRF